MPHSDQPGLDRPQSDRAVANPFDQGRDSSSSQTPDPPGPYRLLSLLGSGGMGEVHLAQHRLLGRRVAIKHIRLDVTRRKEARERLRREAKAAARLSHPSIVQIYDLLESEAGEWIVMELVDGPTLGQLLAHGPVALDRALNLAQQIALGLAEAHAKGVLHRDLKSDNIMLATGAEGDDWRVKIMDFGLAKVLWWPRDRDNPSGSDITEISLTGQGEVMGTCRAMSPEQAKGLPLDGRSDLFSLGSLLYEMLTAISPFQAKSPVVTMTRVVSYEPDPVHSHNPEIPIEVSRLVSRMIAKEIDQRPADCLGLAEEIGDLLGQLPPGLRGRPQGAPPQAQARPTESIVGPISPWQGASPLPAPRSAEEVPSTSRGWKPAALAHPADAAGPQVVGLRMGPLATALLLSALVMVSAVTGFLMGHASLVAPTALPAPEAVGKAGIEAGIEAGNETAAGDGKGSRILAPLGPSLTNANALGPTARDFEPGQEAASRLLLGTRLARHPSPSPEQLARAAADLEEAAKIFAAEGQDLGAAEANLSGARLRRRMGDSVAARKEFQRVAGDLRAFAPDSTHSAPGADPGGGGAAQAQDLLIEVLIDASVGEPDVDLRQPLLEEALRLARRGHWDFHLASAHALLARVYTDRESIALGEESEDGATARVESTAREALSEARSHGLLALGFAADSAATADRGRDWSRILAQLELGRCELVEGNLEGAKLWLERAARDARTASQADLSPNDATPAEIDGQITAILGQNPDPLRALEAEIYLHLEQAHARANRWAWSSEERRRLFQLVDAESL